MRALALLAGLVLSTGLLAGCVNSATQDPPATDGGKKGDITPSSVGPKVTVLAPLATTITTTAAKWVAPGTTIDVAASAPANAKGAVTYLWTLGPLPGTVDVMAKNVDTGSTPAEYIQPGQSKSVKFTTSGVWLMHCHPHPFMKSNVSVVEGYTGPSLVEVKIVDGAKQGEYRFVPENIVIGVGTTVVYNNTGTQPHTATMEKQDPPLKKLPLTSDKGQIALDGKGWQRLKVFVLDSEGRYGEASHDVYVDAIPAPEKIPANFEFNAFLLPPEAPAQAEPAQKLEFSLARPGTIFLNFTAKDAPTQNGGPQNLAQVEVHVKASGATQDTLTSEGKADGALASHAASGPYTLEVASTQGAGVKFEGTIEIVYDLEPPAPTNASAGDGQGGMVH